MYSLPRTWPAFAEHIHPQTAPLLLPLVHIALMSSVYCTIVLSWERYVRICLISNLVNCNYFSSGKFKAYVIIVILFPMIFYAPKFFEVSEKAYIQCVEHGAVIHALALHATCVSRLPATPFPFLHQHLVNLPLEGVFCHSLGLYMSGCIIFYTGKSHLFQLTRTVYLLLSDPLQKRISKFD